MRIQLALQGGGAKLITLLAAARGIQELKEIELTRIAGTSAGAIVGCLLAAGVDLDDFRNLLIAGLGKRLTGSMSEPGGSRWAKTALYGEPLWNTRELKQAMVDVFKRRGEQLKRPLITLKDLYDATGIEVRVIAANLTGSLPITYSPTNNYEIVNALLDSAGIPIYFRTWRHGQIVDGGLVQNFPWEQLLDTDTTTFGPIYGIAFDPSTREIPTGRLSYAKSLLNVAMESNTERARSKLGVDRVLSLPAKYDTFDFASGLDEHALGDHFDSIRQYSRNWFSARARAGNTSDIGADPWSNASISLMEKLGRMYRTQHASTNLKYHSCNFEFTARGLQNPQDADITRYSFSFTPDKDLYCHAMALSQIKSESAFEKSRIVVSGPDKKFIPTDYMPIYDPHTPEKREVLLVFDRVLPAQSGPYTLTVQDTVQGLMKNLAEAKNDDFFVRAERTSSPIGKVQVVVHIPPDFKQARMEISPALPPDQKSGEKMDPFDLEQFTAPAPDWITLGWSGVNVLAQEFFGPRVCI